MQGGILVLHAFGLSIREDAPSELEVSAGGPMSIREQLEPQVGPKPMSLLQEESAQATASLRARLVSLGLTATAASLDLELQQRKVERLHAQLLAAGLDTTAGALLEEARWHVSPEGAQALGASFVENQQEGGRSGAMMKCPCDCADVNYDIDLNTIKLPCRYQCDSATGKCALTDAIGEAQERCKAQKECSYAAMARSHMKRLFASASSARKDTVQPQIEQTYTGRVKSEREDSWYESRDGLYGAIKWYDYEDRAEQDQRNRRGIGQTLEERMQHHRDRARDW